MADHCPADAPCPDRVALKETNDARIYFDDDAWWLETPSSFASGLVAVLYCPWCGGRLVETAPTRCHGHNDRPCPHTATHGPNGKAIACWGHAGDWPEVSRGND